MNTNDINEIKARLDLLLNDYLKLSNISINELISNPYLSERARAERDNCLRTGKQVAAIYTELTGQEYSFEFSEIK